MSGFEHYDSVSKHRINQLLEKAGPNKGPLTREQLEFRIEILQDPHWLDFLGIRPEQAAKSISNYRRGLGRYITGQDR